jgi:hypothetical protein
MISDISEPRRGLAAAGRGFALLVSTFCGSADPNPKKFITELTAPIITP